MALQIMGQVSLTSFVLIDLKSMSTVSWRSARETKKPDLVFFPFTAALG